MPGDGCTSERMVTRREFLSGAVVAVGCLAVSAARRLLGIAPAATVQEPELTPRAYLPLVTKEPPRPTPQAKVVHVHDTGATYWDFSTGWYGDYVDQDVVYEMVDRGLMQLTGRTSRAAAWQALIPDYVPG